MDQVAHRNHLKTIVFSRWFHYINIRRKVHLEKYGKFMAIGKKNST
jgi:hypothetical protein